MRRESDRYRLIDDRGDEQACTDLQGATSAVRGYVRRYVGYHTTDLIFVHAGVVVCGGLAILIPGRSFAGKSTLVEALVRAGADFYSDEYAPLDVHGRVVQYREPLRLRDEQGGQELTGDAHGQREPVAVGLVVLTNYREGASWSPHRLSTATGVVATLAHAIPARDRPAETLAAVHSALTGAAILEGERGEADETAQALLDAIGAVRRWHAAQSQAR